MSEDETKLTPEEKALEDSINKSLSDALGMLVESCGRFKLMVIPDQDPKKAVVTIVFIPRKDGMSQTALSVNFTDIAGFILECSKEFYNKRKAEAEKAKETGNDRMMVS